jgi:hypothetical protein
VFKIDSSSPLTNAISAAIVDMLLSNLIGMVGLSAE